ncbi:Holliday junction branch migration protein RuvA [Helcococcus ovis]|uniref:Holliday junction branch migration complex subunit RuvA n=1 Tax=Helcococcus ovis TaxID=72026 RepID=A0A4R9BZW9_9FIRM|nr:Holliday junction branch migration protein RuvA [Helcococcus ovis]TFF64456.1 Holliday junction branch migration protein RuvA [Helcococcus ovis]TFF64696.1 Holliday junction branch migration protein RuvA [Helcococcus ovis]
MFSYLIGEVKILREDYIVLETNNIGYKIFMSQKNISTLIKNNTYKIYTEFVVRDDAVLLYGFENFDDLEMFLNLKQVSGIGPKAALSILSTLTVYEIELAIIGNDINTISKAPGIGKKSASRIILELSDKIDIEKINNIPTISNPKVNIQNSGDYEFAIEALMNLGYTKMDAENSLKGLNIENMDLSDIVKAALKRM